MRIHHLLPVVLFVVLVAGCGGGDDRAPAPASSSAPAAGPAVQVTGAVVATDAAGDLTIAWDFTLADGWHLYADLVNDSGYPPSIALDLPAGWRAGDLRWPVPERYVQSGGILDHVYHHRLVLEQTLHPPGGERPAAPTAIAATVRWLACRDACVPGQAEVTVLVPTGDLPPVPTYADPVPVFPQPLPAGLVRVEIINGGYAVTAPDARTIRFFPASGGPFQDLVADGEAAGDRLTLRLRPSPSSAPRVVSGLLQVQRGDGTVLTGPFTF